MPLDIEEQTTKQQELLNEYNTLKLFSSEFYISGLSDKQNSCTFSYVETDVIKLEEQIEDFKSYSGQKYEDFFCY